MNTFSNSEDPENNAAIQSKRNISYPSWKSLFNQIIINRENYLSRNRPKQVSVQLKELVKFLNQIKQIIANYHPAKVIEILSAIESNVVVKEPAESVLKNFKGMQIGPNEFYSVYEINSCKYWIIDEKINYVLGLKQEDFNVLAMAGLDKDNPLFYQRDLNHVIRWASLGYLLITLPYFTWTNSEFYYQVQFRVTVPRSSIDRFRNSEYIILNKKCYPYFELNAEGIPIGTYHFDRWSVYSNQNFEFVKPVFITHSEEEVIINDLMFLLNAYLLDLPLKYLLILNERQNLDRNKAIANSLNSKMLMYAGVKANFNESQIGDYFAKSIRERIATTMNLWDKREPDDLVNVDSDQAAVHYAKTLGLLPIPENVERLIYSQISC